MPAPGSPARCRTGRTRSTMSRRCGTSRCSGRRSRRSDRPSERLTHSTPESGRRARWDLEAAPPCCTTNTFRESARCRTTRPPPPRHPAASSRTLPPVLLRARLRSRLGDDCRRGVISSAARSAAKQSIPDAERSMPVVVIGGTAGRIRGRRTARAFTSIKDAARAAWLQVDVFDLSDRAYSSRLRPRISLANEIATMETTAHAITNSATGR